MKSQGRRKFGWLMLGIAALTGLIRIGWPAFPLPGERPIALLNNAQILHVDPQTLYFQLSVESANVDRWVTSRGLQPVASDTPILLPRMAQLELWQRSPLMPQPPLSAAEVDQWWEQRVTQVRFGFYRFWEGGFLVIDLESLSLYGWGTHADLRLVLR